MNIYLDNAATTPLSKEVFHAIEPYLFETFGNPSSAHFYGREAKKAIEQSRSDIAELLHTTPSQITFTSGGTEADNTAILSAIRLNGIKLAITTPFEHHAVLNTLKFLENKGEIKIEYLAHDERGNLSLTHLKNLLAKHRKAFVSVMHANNEIGNLNNIEEIAACCKSSGAIFHSDTVQTMGHYHYDTGKLEVDYLVGSAHKFHGPKGIGFLYTHPRNKVLPLINGGSQEKGNRSGTENVTGIVGLAKALTLANSNAILNQFHIQKLKDHLIKKLNFTIPGIKFNGNSAHQALSLSTVLSVNLPKTTLTPSLLNFLDDHQICASAGSACSSNSTGGSHVLNALGNSTDGTTIRFSFSRYNTETEIDFVAEKLGSLYAQNPARPKIILS
jgi:cysteine desulfurase